MDGNTLSADIYVNTIKQSTTLRGDNLHCIITTMNAAGPYKEASYVFKLFQPPEAPNKRKATPEAVNNSPPNTRNRNNPPAAATDTSTSPTNKIPRNRSTPDGSPSDLINNTTPPQGKTLLKQVNKDPTA